MINAVEKGKRGIQTIREGKCEEKENPAAEPRRGQEHGIA